MYRVTVHLADGKSVEADMPGEDARELVRAVQNGLVRSITVKRDPKTVVMLDKVSCVTVAAL